MDIVLFEVNKIHDFVGKKKRKRWVIYLYNDVSNMHTQKASGKPTQQLLPF